jgi:PAN domain-containing protein
MKRAVLTTAIAAILQVTIGTLPRDAAAQSRFFTVERNIDRPGYELWSVPAIAAADCSFACEGEKKCHAFTFAKPGTHDPFGRCFLKYAVPPWKRDNCCTSGVRKEPRRATK